MGINVFGEKKHGGIRGYCVGVMALGLVLKCECFSFHAGGHRILITEHCTVSSWESINSTHVCVPSVGFEI